MRNVKFLFQKHFFSFLKTSNPFDLISISIKGLLSLFNNTRNEGLDSE